MCGKPASTVADSWQFPLCHECIYDITGQDPRYLVFDPNDEYESLIKCMEAVLKVAQSERE
jgi:hypothetical protein